MDKSRPKTVGQWILKKINTKDWRAGKGKGSKHYKRSSSASSGGKDSIYEMLETVGGRKNFLKQVSDLEKAGIISVVYTTVNQDVKEIVFPLEKADALFEYEKMPNPRKAIIERKEFLKKQIEQTDERWLLDYYQFLYEQLEKGSINENDNVNDENIFKILNALVKLKNDIWERKFSADVLDNSKAFENSYRTRILTILANYSSKVQNEKDVMEEKDILAEHGILTYSQTLEWKGGIVYSIDGALVDTSSMRYGTVLNAQTLSHAEPVSLKEVKKIVSIENKANYEEQKYDPQILYIYTHGFLSPKERVFLKKVEKLIDSTVEVFHWGDMDYGGIRIFLFMKDKVFPKIKPLFMDKITYENTLKEKKGFKLETEKREKLEKINAGELEELKQCILKYGIEFEQENLI